MTTVLTLGGLNYGMADRVGAALSGYASKADRVIVKYPQSASPKSIPAGVEALQQAIQSALAQTAGPIDVVAHSQGAEVVSEWLEQHARRPDAAPPDRLRFILLGNPRRRFGGTGTRGFDGQPLRRTPDDTQYTVLDVARAHDGWCNGDGWPDEKLTLARKARLLGGRFIDHLDYSHVDTATAEVRARTGNTTYLVAP
ncbi:MAG: PE-PPE domain-containing protein [Dietzia sp.]|nr:PE-PPE domain-containing protein [Dietzia sp.]